MSELTEAQMRARGFSEADIAYVRKQKPTPKAPEKPKRARDAKSPYEYIKALLRGPGM